MLGALVLSERRVEACEADMYGKQAVDSRLEKGVRWGYSELENHDVDMFQKKIAMVDQAGVDLLQEKCFENGKMGKVVPTVQHVRDQVDEDR